MQKRPGAMAIALETNNGSTSFPTHVSHASHLMTSVERELQLIDAAKKDPSAFAPLYDAYAGNVYRFAMSRLGNPERAADVTSQTFVKAIQALPRFKPKLQGEETSLLPWLITIARNVVIDEQRKHRPTADIDSPDLQPHMPSARGTPETIAVRKEEQERVRAAIEQLSPRQRRMVELRIAGYSGKEIAEIMNITLNGVRTAHSRAYSRLRELLAEDV